MPGGNPAIPGAAATVAALKSCRTASQVRKIHQEAAARGAAADLFVAATLIHMYARRGRLDEAIEVFRGMDASRSIVPWNCLVLGCVDRGEEELGLAIVGRLLSDEVNDRSCDRLYGFGHGLILPAPNHVTFLAAIKACTNLVERSIKGNKLVDDAKRSLLQRKFLRRGKSIQAKMARLNDEVHIYVANALIDLYATCGSMDDASIVFEAMAESSVVSWTEMILGFVENGNESIALDLHSRMQREGLVPDSIAFVAAIKACSRLAAKDESIDDALRRGRTVHRQAARNALETNVFVANSLIDLYSKCRKLDLARQIFEGTSSIDLVTWNSIILAHAEGGEAEIALELFETMRIEGIFAPNHVTFLAAIKACVCLSQIEAGTLIDAKMVKSTSLSRIKTIHSLADQPRTDRLHHFVANSLVHAYSRCGSMIDAARVFASIRRKDPLSWSEIILGYAESGEAKTALDLYARMKQEHCPMNHVTILAAIKACSSAAERGGIEITSWCLDQGRNIHRDAIDSGNDRQIFVASALIDMYAKCGSLADASSVFDAMDHRNTVAWNALILGNVESDRANAALELFARMKREGFDPDAITYVAVLRACSRLGDLETGIEIEQELRAAGIIDKDTSVCNSLVDFYGKCGSMIDARRVFDSIGDERRDVVTWNALIDGYSRQGDTERAFYAFEMLCSGESSIKPDGVSFLAVLVLCSHAGLVDRAKSYFQAMVLEHGIVPERRHLVCLVDLLGRADRLDEAVAVAEMVGGDAGDVVWTSILGSSRKWKNARVGKIAFRAMKELESSPSAYVLMSDLYKPQTKHG